MKQKFLALAFIAGLMVFGGCYPDGVEYYSETDVVYTDYDDSFKFETKQTYAIPDKIVIVTGNISEGEEPEFVKEPYNTQMLHKMESNMTAMGYTKIEDPTNADLALLPAVWTNTTIYYWQNYWCWYNPYYCGWGPNVSTQTSGTLVMTLLVDGDDYIQPTRVWTAAANGLLSGTYNATRVNNAIDQAFKQSPYLETN